MSTVRTTVRRAILIAALLFTWLAVSPTTVGGAANYVKVAGNSMEPTFHYGDTVMLHRHDHYEVGDIIAYRSQQLNGAVVIHRIIEVTADGHYVTKGDHNTFIDTYHPSIDDVLGKRVTRIPGTAKVADALHTPIGVATAALLAGTLIYFGNDRGSRHRRRAMRGRSS